MHHQKGTLKTAQNAMEDVIKWVTADQGFAGLDLDRVQAFVTYGVVGEPHMETFERGENIEIKLITPVLDKGTITSGQILMKVGKKDIEFGDGAGLGKMKPEKGGRGLKWFIEGQYDNYIKLMPANPKARWDCQKVDYVRITRGGKVIGPDQKEIKGEKPSHTKEAHIPRSVWRTWKHPLGEN